MRILYLFRSAFVGLVIGFSIDGLLTVATESVNLRPHALRYVAIYFSVTLAAGLCLSVIAVWEARRRAELLHKSPVNDSQIH